MPRWDLVYKWADPETQSLVGAVTSALENCDRKLTEAATPQPEPAGLDADIEHDLVAVIENYRRRDNSTVSTPECRCEVCFQADRVLLARLQRSSGEKKP